MQSCTLPVLVQCLRHPCVCRPCVSTQSRVAKVARCRKRQSKLQVMQIRAHAKCWMRNSCPGQKINSPHDTHAPPTFWIICGAGFPYDRYWMIVTEAEGRFVTQRQESKLALIGTQLPHDACLQGSSSHPDPTAALRLSAPDMPPVQVQQFKKLPSITGQNSAAGDCSNTRAVCFHSLPSSGEA